MKTNLTVLSVTSGLLMLLATWASAQSTPPEPSVNFIVNGSFEHDGNNDGAADYWFVHPGVQKAVSGGTVQWISGADAHSGKSFLRVSKSGGEQPFAASGNVRQQQIPLLIELSEKPLVLSAWMRGENLTGGARVILHVYAKKAGAEHERFVTNITTKPEITGTTGWTEAKTRFRLGDILLPDETLTRMEVSLSVSSNTGHADFDAVTLSTEN